MIEATEDAPSSIDVVEVSHEDSVIMSKVGKLRYDVWLGEGSLAVAQFPDGVWLDLTDAHARHFVAVEGATGTLAGAARLVTHRAPGQGDRDVELWTRTGHPLFWPVCDLGRLVVDPRFRGRGVARSLNVARVTAAQRLGAGCVIATASAGNASILKRMGFADTGETIVFDDRPHTTFYALQLNLAASHELADPTHPADPSVPSPAAAAAVTVIVPTNKAHVQESLGVDPLFSEVMV